MSWPIPHALRAASSSFHPARSKARHALHRHTSPRHTHHTCLIYPPHLRRDPNLLETVDTYDGSPEFLRTLEMDRDTLTKAIIGTIGDVDSYQLPDAKGYSAMSRYLLGISDEERQVRREQILGTSQKDFRAFAEVLECVRGEAGRVVAVTSAEKAKAALEQRPGFFEVKKVV